jgi:hypothetical protein
VEDIQEKQSILKEFYRYNESLKDPNEFTSVEEEPIEESDMGSEQSLTEFASSETNSQNQVLYQGKLVKFESASSTEIP